MPWTSETRVATRITFSALLRVFGEAVLVAAIVSLGGCAVGDGLPGSDGTLTPSSSTVSFGNVTVGTSTAQLVSLKNNGDSNIKISTVSVSGKGFSVGGGSSVTLTPNQSVTVSVNFSPSAEGLAQGTLSVSSNASNKSLKIGITATAVAKAAHTVDLSWQAGSSGVLGYYVYRGAAAGDLSKLTKTIDPNTSYADSSVEGGQTYVYAVTSVNSKNVESAPSSPVSVTIPDN